MKKCVALATTLVLLAGVSESFAQPGNVDAIKKQIAALQQQVAEMESATVSRNVTQIGSSRLRGMSRRGDLVVRIYDLGDLFAVAPTYIASSPGDLDESQAMPLFTHVPRGAGGGGFGGGGFFSTPSTIQSSSAATAPIGQFGGEGAQNALPTVTQADLIKTIKKTIAPDIWEEAGGPATIATLGNAYVISADEDTHQQIDGLLNLFRNKWGTLRTVSLRAYWVWLTDDELDGLLIKKPANGKAAKHAFGLVDDAKWPAVLKRENGKRGKRATITCYNGQTVSTVSGNEQLVVKNIRPVLLKGDDDTPQGRVAYRTQMGSLLDGVALQVTPIANVAGDVVLLDVHSRVGIVSMPAKQMQKVEEVNENGPTPADLVSVIDRPESAVSKLETTIRAPIDRMMLVGGMSFNQGDDSASDLYLFVKVAVQELRSDEPEAETPKDPQPEPPGDAPADEAKTPEK